jgi:hypothetical protein
MARPKLETHPMYERLEKAKRQYVRDEEDLQAQIEELVGRARRESRKNFLAVVREAYEAGMSDSAVGRITGNTSYASRLALRDEAFGSLQARINKNIQAGNYIAGEPFEFAGWTVNRVMGDNANPGPSIIRTIMVRSDDPFEVNGRGYSAFRVGLDLQNYIEAWRVLGEDYFMDWNSEQEAFTAALFKDGNRSSLNSYADGLLPKEVYDAIFVDRIFYTKKEADFDFTPPPMKED